MIKSTIIAFCDLRASKKAFIQIEIASYQSTPEGTNYVVNDYTLTDDGQGNFSKTLINTKTVFYSAAKINMLNEYLETTHDYSGLTKIERDWAKVVEGLLLDTQTNLYEDGLTIYRLQPSDWVKS